MPHSSGGGSHGGGFHSSGGSHGGGSGNRVSNHYFYGARRYRRHHRSTGLDEYVYATSRPQKTGIVSIIFTAVIGLFFFMGVGLSTRSETPKKLNSYDFYEPAVYDGIDVIEDKAALTSTLNEYYSITGICPVIYTVYDEEWSNINPELNHTYADLETYAYCKYVDNFSDEQHFVIVYSITKSDAELVKSGKITVPNYQWEAVQGDDTDYILTEGMFRVFGKKVQNDLEAGKGPGQAFENAFRFAIGDAESRLQPLSFSNVFSRIGSLFPMLIVAAFFIPILIMSIRKYINDRDVEYEEVPLDDGDIGAGQNVSAKAYAYNSNGYSRSVSTSTASKVGLIFSLIFMIPFVLVGIGTIIGGVAMRSSGSDGNGGSMLIGFGVIWTSLVAIMLAGIITSLVRTSKRNKEENKEGYPQAPAGYSNGARPEVTYSTETGQEIHDPGAIPVTPVYSGSDPVRPFVPSGADTSSPFVPSSSGSPSPFVPSGSGSASPFVPAGQDASNASESSSAAPSSPFVPLNEQPEFDSRFFESPKSNIEDDDEDYKRMKRRGYE